MEWPAKDILISFKPLVFEKRMDLVLSSPEDMKELFFIISNLLYPVSTEDQLQANSKKN